MNWCAESGQALPIGLERLILCPHYLTLLATINSDNLAMNMTAEIVAGDGQDGHGNSFDGNWLAQCCLWLDQSVIQFARMDVLRGAGDLTGGGSNVIDGGVNKSEGVLPLLGLQDSTGVDSACIPVPIAPFGPVLGRLR